MQPQILAPQTKTILIDTIIDLNRDQFRTPQDFVNLARETESQLIQRLVKIARDQNQPTNKTT
jgi:hypothetical protein